MTVDKRLKIIERLESVREFAQQSSYQRSDQFSIGHEQSILCHQPIWVVPVEWHTTGSADGKLMNLGSKSRIEEGYLLSISVGRFT